MAEIEIDLSELPDQEEQVTPTRKKSFGEKFSESFKQFVSPTVGAIKGVGSTIAGGSELIQRGLRAATNPLTSALGVDQKEIERPEALKEALTPQNTGEKIGFGMEQIGEFFVPVGAAAKAGKFIKGAKALQTAEGAGTLARAGKAIGRGLVTPAVEAATTGGVSALQEGELNQNVATNAALGAAFPVVAGVGAGVKKFAGKYLPEALTKSALNLTPTQKVAIKNIGSGKATAESYLLKNGITGEPEEIAKKLLSKSREARKAKLAILEDLGGEFKHKEAEAIAKNLKEALGGEAGLERAYEKVDEIYDALTGKGASLGQLDELKSLADEFASPYKAMGTVKESVRAKGMEKLRSSLQKFIEDESAKVGVKNIRALNNEIRLTRKIGDAISKQEAGAGGNAVAKLSDWIVGGSVLGGGVGGVSSGNLDGALKGALAGTTAVLLKKSFTPAIKLKIANSLTKAFNGGEAGIILKFLKGEGKLTGKQKNKLSEALIDSGIAVKVKEFKKRAIKNTAL